jgi:hypothetical protein
LYPGPRKINEVKIGKRLPEEMQRPSRGTDHDPCPPFQQATDHGYTP